MERLLTIILPAVDVFLNDLHLEEWFNSDSIYSR